MGFEMVEGLKFQFAHEELHSHLDKMITTLEAQLRSMEAYPAHTPERCIEKRGVCENTRDAITKLTVFREHLIPARYILTCQDMQDIGLI
jgi:hypothetical protein